MPPKTPTQKGGGNKTPQGSSGKKKVRDRSTPSEDLGPSPVELDAVLQISRSELSGPDKVLMATVDMRKMGFRAGDWVVIRSKQVDPDLSPYEGLVVLRAWPGPTVPVGTVVGCAPFASGQFGRPLGGGEGIGVGVRGLGSANMPVLPLASAVLRLVVTDPKQPPYTQAGSSVFFRERLQDLLWGMLLFPNLCLAFTVFGRTYKFQVASVTAEDTAPSSPPSSSPPLSSSSPAPAPPTQSPPSMQCAIDAENDGDVLARHVSTLSLAPPSSDMSSPPLAPPCASDGAPVYLATRGRSTLLLADHTDYGSRPLGPSKGQGGAGEEEEEEGDAWASVGGLEEQIAELRAALELPLLQPETFVAYGLRPPRGLLLTGPPGTGKSLVLRAAGRELRRKGVHVMPLSGPELVSGVVGETEAQLKKVFDEARRRSPSVVVLDEAEALAGKRDGTRADGQRRVVSTFLALMDGYSSMDKVVVLAATSVPSALDPAVRRPGRFDREIELGVPGEAARASILRVLLTQAGPMAADLLPPPEKKKLPEAQGSVAEGRVAEGPASIECEDVISAVASKAHGFVGGDLLLLCKEAAMEAMRRREGREEVRLRANDLRVALTRVRPSALREVTVEVPRVLWVDIGGQEGVKQALREAVEWPLTHPEAFTRMGIAPPKGVLLYGPPGCSKTLMARALATESSMNFLAVKGPELLSKWLGESERALQGLFKKARAAAPTVIFFDEIDALAGKRGGGDSRASERVLSQLLTELDGIQPLKRVVVIAATNRPDLIDVALLRPGRIGRMVYVPPPDLASRCEILSIALRGVPIAQDVDVQALARSTDGFSGAEVVAVCREAALLAIGEDPENASCLRSVHLQQAIATWKPQITPDMLGFYAQWAASHSEPI